MKLVKYDAARKALAAAVRVDEVKSIRNKAIAMEVYAKQAQDGELMAHATEMRKRAEQRLGEMMDEARKAGTLAKGARGSGSNQHKKVVRVAEKPTPTLADMGIDKNLADRARKTAAMSEAKFEKHVAEAVRRAVAATEGDKKIVAEARAAQQVEKQKHRAKRERDLGTKLVAMPTKRYGVIYADPPWKFRTFSLVGMDRSAENHYPTMTVDQIKALAVPAADDCALFLWATSPMLLAALDVMAAWGFTYKTNCVWVKDKPGTGYWYRNQHELLLVGTKGNIPAPVPGSQPSSLQMYPVGAHSEKPVAFRHLIDEWFPNLPKLEMFARHAIAIPGWDTWGNEAAA